MPEGLDAETYALDKEQLETLRLEAQSVSPEARKANLISL